MLSIDSTRGDFTTRSHTLAEIQIKRSKKTVRKMPWENERKLREERRDKINKKKRKVNEENRKTKEKDLKKKTETKGDSI